MLARGSLLDNTEQGNLGCTRPNTTPEERHTIPLVSRVALEEVVWPFAFCEALVSAAFRLLDN